MKLRWWIVGGVGIVTVGVLMGARGKEKKGAEDLPFRIGKVQQEDLQVSVRDVGTVDPYVKVDVKATVSGQIRGLHVREGAVVKAGQMLAEVEPDVNQATVLSNVKGDLIQAEVSFQNAQRDHLQHEALFKAGLISDQVYRTSKTRRDLAEETFKAAQTRYQIVEDRGIPISGKSTTQMARVISPMNGVVIRKGVELGDTITSGVSSFNAGTVIFTVADLDSLIIRVNLNEVDIAKVSQGNGVRITLDAYPQRTFQGEVRFVSPAAKLLEKIKVFEVEVKIKERSEIFKPGMSANVEILGDRRDKALSIPLEALQRRENDVIVYRLKKNLSPESLQKAQQELKGRNKFTWMSENWKDYFETVKVQAGVATLERVEILSGLQKEDQISLEDPTRKKIEKDENL